MLQTVIPANRQSLGATERRRRLFRTTMDRVIGNKKPKNLGNKEWKEFAEMTTMRLNSQVQQYDGSALGETVFGRTPKLPIAVFGNPLFEDFTNPAEATTTETHGLLIIIHKIRRPSPKCRF